MTLSFSGGRCPLDIGGGNCVAVVVPLRGTVVALRAGLGGLRKV